MSYRVTYQVNVDWVGEGVGPMSGNTGPNAGMAPAGGNQRLTFFNTGGGQNSKTFTASDITTLTSAIASDMSAQFTASATRIQNFSTGTG